MNRSEAFKMDTEVYSDLCEDTSEHRNSPMYSVFGNKSEFCYSTHLSKESADSDAAEINKLMRLREKLKSNGK